MSATKRKMTMRERAARAERAAQRPILRVIHGGLSGKTNVPHREDFGYFIPDEHSRYGYAHCPECGERVPVTGGSKISHFYAAAEAHAEEAH